MSSAARRAENPPNGQWRRGAIAAFLRDVKRDLRDGVRDEGVHVLVCLECPRVSTVEARGWRAYRVENAELDEPPKLAFYCAVCAAREFG